MACRTLPEHRLNVESASLKKKNNKNNQTPKDERVRFFLECKTVPTSTIILMSGGQRGVVGTDNVVCFDASWKCKLNRNVV